MNKSELIDSIAAASGLTKTDSAKALDAFVSSVSAALKSGDDVRLVGFGTFEVKTRAERKVFSFDTQVVPKVEEASSLSNVETTTDEQL